jgi:hypothetical protein
LIVATPVVPLVHVPPLVDELKVMLLPIHIAVDPVIAAGAVATVTIVVV